MAIKIIDSTPDPKVVKRRTCYNCGVLLEYTPNDTRTVKQPEIGGIDVFKVIDCPNCPTVLRV